MLPELIWFDECKGGMMNRLKRAVVHVPVEGEARVMKRERIVTVDVLEPKSLPSAPALMAPVAGTPPLVARVDQGLRIDLATDQQVYRQGQPVVVTLTETNTSHRTVEVALGPSTDGFYVTQNGAEVWTSNKGPQPLFLMVKRIKPGASLRLSATWNGHTNIGSPSSPTGTFVVHSQIPGAAPVTIQIVPS
jgi:hypothetical protein